MTGFFLERCALFYYETCYAQIGDLEAMTSVKLPRRHRKLFRLTNKTVIQHHLGSMLWFFKAYKIYYALFKLTEKTHKGNLSACYRMYILYTNTMKNSYYHSKSFKYSSYMYKYT